MAPTCQPSRAWQLVGPSSVPSRVNPPDSRFRWVLVENGSTVLVCQARLLRRGPARRKHRLVVGRQVQCGTGSADVASILTNHFDAITSTQPLQSELRGPS